MFQVASLAKHKTTATGFSGNRFTFSTLFSLYIIQLVNIFKLCPLMTFCTPIYSDIGEIHMFLFQLKCYFHSEIAQ